MSIHTVIEETTIRSQVEILGPPGASTEMIAQQAHQEMDQVKKLVAIYEMPTDVFVDPPIYQDDQNKWLVNITIVYRASRLVTLKD